MRTREVSGTASNSPYPRDWLRLDPPASPATVGRNTADPSSRPFLVDSRPIHAVFTERTGSSGTPNDLADNRAATAPRSPAVARCDWIGRP